MKVSLFLSIALVTLSSTLARLNSDGQVKRARGLVTAPILDENTLENSAFRRRRAASEKDGGKKGKAEKSETGPSMDSPQSSPVYSPTASSKNGKSSSAKKSGSKGSKKSEDGYSSSPKVKADKGSNKSGDDSADKGAKGKDGKGKDGNGEDSIDKGDKGKSKEDNGKGKDGKGKGEDGGSDKTDKGKGKDAKGKKGEDDSADKPPASAPVAMPYHPTSPPAAPSPTMPAPILPVPTVPAPTAAPTFSPDDMELYRIRSCGEIPEDFVTVEVSYLYTVRILENADRDAAIQFIEAETLKSVSSELFDCELSRRRLNTLVGVTALPQDVASGSCGERCTDVVGGMSIYVEDQGSSDFTQLQCTALDVIRRTMLEIESVEGGIEEISFVDDSDFDCESILGRGLPGVVEADPEKSAMNKYGRSLIPIVIGSVVGAALIAGFALFAVKRRRSNETTHISVVGDKGDLISVGTPESAAGDTQFTPQMSMNTPNKGSPLSTLPDTPEYGYLDADGSPIAQFDPAMIDATSRAGNNVNAVGSGAPGAVGTAATVGAGTALLSRFMRGEKMEEAAAPSMPQDLLYDNGDHEAQGTDAAHLSPPPMMMRTQNDDFMQVDTQIQHSAEYSTLILSDIPEVSDDASVDTAAVSNKSPSRKEV